MRIGDIVFYNKDKCKLDIGEGVIEKIIKTNDGTRLTVRNYKENDVVCNGVLGIHFFSTKTQLRLYFGKTEKQRQNLDLIKKSTLAYYLKNKFPNLITDDVVQYIFDLPNYDAEMYGEICNKKQNEENENIEGHCSICGQTLTDDLMYANYCPNCGGNLFKEELGKAKENIENICKRVELLNRLHCEDNDEELFDDLISEGYNGDSDFFWDNL